MYSQYLSDRKCTLITVEDPAPDFQRMKDGLDTKLILQHGFFFTIRQALKKNGRRNFLQPELLKECTLDHIEIAQIRNKLKLAKNNIQRCFEFVLICLLDPKDPNAHENYRKGILKRMAECRTLLRPYFRYENFADRSMYNDNLLGGEDEIEREVAHMRENCCNGEGELNCFKEEDEEEEMSPLTPQRGNQAYNNNIDRGRQCNGSNPELDQAINKLRPNRFTPTPWHEMQSPT